MMLRSDEGPPKIVLIPLSSVIEHTLRFLAFGFLADDELAIFGVYAKRYRLVRAFDGDLVTLDEVAFELVLGHRYTMFIHQPREFK
jgi:hypothetical protein